MKRTAVMMFLGILATGASAQDLGEPAQNTEATGAQAIFIDMDGNELGTATLTETDGGVAIAGRLEGIPEGEHGFHIHETGDCDPATSFESAGDHFNPQDNQHGFENPEGAHAGDADNQTADANGQMMIDVTVERVSLIDGDENNLMDEDGSTLMVHADPDDYITDPSGNSGDRIACAVIEPVGG